MTSGAPEPDGTAPFEADSEAPGRRPTRGDQAPDFTLEGTGGRSYTLSAYRGEPVVVVFYPADHTPVCTAQLRSYSEDLDAFRALGATVLCLSPQDVASHEQFAAAQGLRVPLLADVGATVGRAYDILGPLGFYRRSVFVVDPEGVVRFARRSLSSLSYVPVRQLLDAVRASARP